MGVEASVKPAARFCFPATDHKAVAGTGQRDIQEAVFLLAGAFLLHLARRHHEIRPHSPGRPEDKTALRIANKLVGRCHRLQHVRKKDHRRLKPLRAMDGHHPHLVARRAVQVAPHLPATPAKLGKKGRQ